MRVSPAAPTREGPQRTSAAEHQLAPLQGININGIAATGCVDLAFAGTGEPVGFLCVPNVTRRRFVRGQVVELLGPMLVEGEQRDLRGEFKITRAWDCVDGQCVDLAVAPLFIR